MKHKYITITLVLAVLALALWYFAGDKAGEIISGDEPVACTMEARICPDGTAVGRTGPKCEFAPCPNTEVKPEAKNETKPEGALGVGETKFVNGVRITLNKILEDSRCPINAMCIQAGKIVADVTLKSDTDTETLPMATDGTVYPFGAWTITVIDNTYGPSAGKTLTPEDYKLTFKVEKL